MFIQTAAEKKVCEDYLNLRFSSTIYDSMLGAPGRYIKEVGAFRSKHPDFNLPEDASIFHIYSMLRQKINKAPKAQRLVIIKDWGRLSEDVRRSAFREEKSRDGGIYQKGHILHTRMRTEQYPCVLVSHDENTHPGR